MSLLPVALATKQQIQPLLLLITTTTTAITTTTTQQLSPSSTNNEPNQPQHNNNNNDDDDMFSVWNNLPPHARSVIYMGLAMALHFGGYEFIRNACWALFTSREFGFASHPTAIPIAIGLVSPFSVLLLYGYSQQLTAVGPRGALFRTTAASGLWIVFAASALAACQYWNVPLLVRQVIIGITFLFQNSYQYLLYTQQWSFCGSVLTPDQASRWFAWLAGTSSLVCTMTSSLVPVLSPRLGLLGMLALTAVTLTGTCLASDAAYRVAQQHGFDPQPDNNEDDKKKSTWQSTRELFQRVPTLTALLAEVLAFQSLNTILTVALFTALPSQIPDDLARSAFTGKLYAAINGLSAVLQFAILPVVMKFLEPVWLWRIMPGLVLVACVQLLLLQGSSVTALACAFLVIKVLDYSFRQVVYVMAYQPLDYESRYLGKEMIGVLGSRLGKSGMSWILSGLTMALGQSSSLSLWLIRLSCGVSILWWSTTWWLSRLLPRQAQAQAVVQERQERQHKKMDSSKQEMAKED